MKATKGTKVFVDENIAGNAAKAAAQRKNPVRQAFADVASSANLHGGNQHDGAGVAKKPTRFGVSTRSIKPEAKEGLSSLGASTSSLSSLAALGGRAGSTHSLASSIGGVSSRPSTAGSVVLPSIATGHERQQPQQQTHTQTGTHLPVINMPQTVRMSLGPDSKSAADSSTQADRDEAMPQKQQQSVQQQQTTAMSLRDSGRFSEPLLSTRSLQSDTLLPDPDSPLDRKMTDLSIEAVDMSDCPEVAAYITDIMAYMRRSEARRHPNPIYMTKQSDINSKMREILIDWLVEVHLKFELQQETLFLAVHIIDRFLERRAVSRNKLQLVGCTAMLIAAKYEEIYAPEVEDFVYISDKAYKKEQILAMEAIMLNTLNFNLTVPSPLRFAERFLKAAHGNDTLRLTVGYFMEQTLQDLKFLKYLPSMVAASALCLAVNTVGGAWNPALQGVCQYNEKDLTACMQDLHYVLSLEAPKYRAVRKKYSHKAYGQVALQRARLPSGVAALPQPSAHPSSSAAPGQ